MPEEESEESGGGKKKLLIIIVALLLLVGIGAGAYFFLMGPKEEEAVKMEPQTKEEEEIASTSQKDTVKLVNPKFTPPRKYTVNLRDGKHFLKITLVAALEDEMALLFLASRAPLVDDKVLSYLQNLTTDDIRRRGGLDLIKREIYKKVNSVFTQEFIEESETKDRTPVKKILLQEFLLN